MGFLDFITGKTVNQLQQQVKSLQNLISARYSLNGVTLYPEYKQYEHAERYCTTDDVYSVVSYLAMVASMVPIYAYKKDADGKLIQLPENDPLNLLLEMPFEGMSKHESLFAIYATKLTQGEAFILKEIPELGPNKGKVIKLHYLEPQNVLINITDTYPKKIIGYQYVQDGNTIYDNLTTDEVIHLKYFNPLLTGFNNGFRGLSPLKVLAKRLTRMDANNDVATAQLQNGGVPGIVHEKGNYDNIVEVVGKRKDNFYKYLQNRKNVGSPYFSVGDMGYIELGLKLADLSVAELEKIDFKKLCNVYRVSDRLFNNDATGSEVSDKGARVSLYTNAVLPEVKALRDALINGLVKTDFKGQNYTLKEDITEIPELQQNVKEMADAFAAMPIMIPKQILSAFSLEVEEDENLNKVYVKNGYVLLDDLNMPIDVQNTGDYGQENNV